MEVNMKPLSVYEAIAAVEGDDYSLPSITFDKGHDRIGQRTVRTSTILNAYLGQICRIDRHVTNLVEKIPAMMK